MKRIATLHKSQNFQQVQPPNPWSWIREPESQREEDIVWLTSDEFKEEVCRLLKEKIDAWERSKVR